MRRRRWFLPLIICGIVVVLVVGVPGLLLFLFLSPWDTTPTRADVVGTWEDGSSSRRIIITSTGRITFDNIPSGVVDETGDKDAGHTKLETTSGRLDAFYREGGIGPEAAYTVPAGGGTVGALWSTGNNVFGRRLILYFGDGEQFEYDFHRVSNTP
jgi:hypothetical protein